jgi:hypothetical protein
MVNLLCQNGSTGTGTHVARRTGCEGKARSRCSRLGVASRVGGPDCSDEPAVEGLVIS